MAVKKRVAVILKDQDKIDKILALTENTITTSMITELFGDFGGKREYNPYDIITVPAGVYGYDKHKNKSPFTTTVGRYIFNRYFVEPHPGIFSLKGYINKNVSKKVLEGTVNDIAYAMMEGKIDIKEYKIFLNKTQKFMPYISILTPNHTENMLLISKEINKEKAKYKKELDKAIEEGDIKTVDEISNHLLEYARELLKDDPSMDMFDSGAGGSFENNFKNMFVMRGAVKDPDPAKGYNVITSNYIDGITKEEYSKLANTLASGPYSRSKKTELGGYWEKLFMSAFQHIILLDPGSDCGTNRYIEMDVTSKNIDSIMYSYVIGSNGKLTEITSENRNDYIGKHIKLRFASMCEAKDGICNKCAGNLFYRLGIRNIGAATPQIASKLKLLSMKLFHDDQINFSEMDPMKAFMPK